MVCIFRLNKTRKTAFSKKLCEHISETVFEIQSCHKSPFNLTADTIILNYKSDTTV